MYTLPQYRYQLEKRCGVKIFSDADDYEKLIRVKGYMESIGLSHIIRTEFNRDEIEVIIASTNGTEYRYTVKDGEESRRLGAALFRLISSHLYNWVDRDMEYIESKFDRNSKDYDSFIELGNKTLRYIRLNQMGFRPHFNGISKVLNSMDIRNVDMLLNLIGQVV